MPAAAPRRLRLLQHAMPAIKRLWQRPRLTAPVVRAQEGHPVRLLPLLVHSAGLCRLGCVFETKFDEGGGGAKPCPPRAMRTAGSRCRSNFGPDLAPAAHGGLSDYSHRHCGGWIVHGKHGEVKLPRVCHAMTSQDGLSPPAARACCRPAVARSAAPARRLSLSCTRPPPPAVWATCK